MEKRRAIINDGGKLTLVLSGGSQPSISDVAKNVSKCTPKELQSLLLASIETQLPQLCCFLFELPWEPLPVDFKLLTENEWTSATFLLECMKIYGDRIDKTQQFVAFLKSLKLKPVMFANEVPNNDHAIYKKMSEYGYLIEPKALEAKFFINDYPFINAVLSKIPATSSWWQENGLILLRSLMDMEDPYAMNVLLTHCPKILSTVPYNYLQKQFLLEKKIFVTFLLVNGLTFLEKGLPRKRSVFYCFAHT